MRHPKNEVGAPSGLLSFCRSGPLELSQLTGSLQSSVKIPGSQTWPTRLAFLAVMKTHLHRRGLRFCEQSSRSSPKTLISYLRPSLPSIPIAISSSVTDSSTSIRAKITSSICFSVASVFSRLLFQFFSRCTPGSLRRQSPFPSSDRSVFSRVSCHPLWIFASFRHQPSCLTIFSFSSIRLEGPVVTKTSLPVLPLAGLTNSWTVYPLSCDLFRGPATYLRTYI